MFDSRSRRPIALVAAAAAGLAAFALPTAAHAGDKGPKPPKADFTLTILHANDLESSLLPKVTASGEVYGGADRFVELIQQQQHAATTGKPAAGQAGKRGVITISAGDNFLPGAQLNASEGTGQPIYDAQAFIAAGFDVSILGNHDFDNGPDYLGRYLTDLGDATQFVSGNLGFAEEPALLAQVEDGTIVTTHVEKIKGERIGIIGLTTPDLPQLTSSQDVVVDPALAKIANAQAAAYEAGGVDKVILVSHLQDIDNELALVPQLRGVDVVVSGGGHELLSTPGDPVIPGNSTPVYGAYPQVPTDADGDIVPVVTTAALYNYVGRLVVNFDKDGELLSVDEAASRAIPVVGQGADAVQPDQQVLDSVILPVQAATDELRETVVAVTEVPLNGVTAEVRSRETNLGNLVTDALLDAGQDYAAELGVTSPIVALQNGGGIRNNTVIPAGSLSAFDTYTIVPFSNFVAIAPAMPVDTFIAGVERGLSGLPGAAGSFAQASGYRVTYNVSAPAGDRIVDLVLDDGTVLVEDGVATGALSTISVASIDFLLRGSDGYPFAGVGFTVVPMTQQAAFEAYLTEDLNGLVSAEDYPVGGEGRIAPAV